uniref:GLOBIN domain-containing protein n=1 Tax=Parastrongyloides trichosuri TaxID=131310 RepID=A0A0N4ZJB3_PARTI
MGQNESRECTTNKISHRKRCKSADAKFKNSIHRNITNDSSIESNPSSTISSGCISSSNNSSSKCKKDRRTSSGVSDDSTTLDHKHNLNYQKVSTKEFLTPRQRTLLVRSWNKSQKTGLDNIGATIFFKIYANDSTVGRMFGLQGVPLSELKYKKFFQSHAMTFTRSLDFCISNLENPNIICNYCFHLGRRHVAFAKRGFRMSYWDTFAEALTECAIEWEGGLRCRDILHGWRKLITFIIDEMRNGYVEERRAGGKGDRSVMDNVVGYHNAQVGRKNQSSYNLDSKIVRKESLPVSEEEEYNLRKERNMSEQTPDEFTYIQGSSYETSGCPMSQMIMLIEDARNKSISDNSPDCTSKDLISSDGESLSNFANTYQGNLSIPRCNGIRRSQPNLTKSSPVGNESVIETRSSNSLLYTRNNSLGNEGTFVNQLAEDRKKYEMDFFNMDIDYK